MIKLGQGFSKKSKDINMNKKSLEKLIKTQLVNILLNQKESFTKTPVPMKRKSVKQMINITTS